MIKPIPGIWYAVDILNGQKPFPTNKQKKGEGFKELLEKEMEKINEHKTEGEIRKAKSEALQV